MAVRTVTENEYSSCFRDFIGKLEEPQWLRDLRTRAFWHFSAVGFPTPRLEDWKYTNVAPIGKQVWKIEADHPNSLSEIDEQIERSIRSFQIERNGLTAFNFAFADFKAVRIPQETS